MHTALKCFNILTPAIFQAMDSAKGQPYFIVSIQFWESLSEIGFHKILISVGVYSSSLLVVSCCKSFLTRKGIRSLNQISYAVKIDTSATENSKIQILLSIAKA